MWYDDGVWWCVMCVCVGLPIHVTAAVLLRNSQKPGLVLQLVRHKMLQVINSKLKKVVLWVSRDLTKYYKCLEEKTYRTIRKVNFYPVTLNRYRTGDTELRYNSISAGWHRCGYKYIDNICTYVRSLSGSVLTMTSNDVKGKFNSISVAFERRHVKIENV